MTNEEVEDFLLKKAETVKALTDVWLTTTSEALAREAGSYRVQITQVLRNMQNEGKIELVIHNRRPFMSELLDQTFGIRIPAVDK